MATPIDPNTCEQVSPDTWSQFPAKGTVNISCYDIEAASAVSFCESGVRIAADLSGNLDVSGQVVFAAPPQSASAPVGSTDLVPKSYVDALEPFWAQGPATDNMELSCNNLVRVGGIEFCDGLATITAGSPTVISGTQKMALTAGGATSLTVDGDANSVSISASAQPIFTTTPVSYASNQLIPRSIIDLFINISYPAISGHLPNVCYNVHKNLTKSSANLTSTATDGNLYYLYPYVNTPIRNVIITTATSFTAYTGNFGFALIEFDKLTDISGVCVASTGMFSSPFTTASTRYVTPFTSYSPPGATEYTLKAGKKYAVATFRGSTTTFTLLGLGMTSSDYSGGFIDPSNNVIEMQSSGVYSTVDPVYPIPTGIPVVGNIVKYASGSGFLPVIGLEY